MENVTVIAPPAPPRPQLAASAAPDMSHTDPDAARETLAEMVYATASMLHEARVARGRDVTDEKWQAFRDTDVTRPNPAVEALRPEIARVLGARRWEVATAFDVRDDAGVTFDTIVRVRAAYDRVGWETALKSDAENFGRLNLWVRPTLAVPASHDEATALLDAMRQADGDVGDALDAEIAHTLSETEAA